MKQYLFIGLLILACGCAPDPAELIKVKELNIQSFNNPEYIGILNGKVLYRVYVYKETSGAWKDTVYYLSDNKTNLEDGVSINYQRGNQHKVVILIDGIPYTATPPTQ